MNNILLVQWKWVIQHLKYTLTLTKLLQKKEELRNSEFSAKNGPSFRSTDSSVLNDKSPEL